MSGVRLACFSKYFAVGMTVAVMGCARHYNWLQSQVSGDLQEHYASVARYADQVADLEASLKRTKASTKSLPQLQGIRAGDEYNR
ncbi:hypothetical protein TcYC6_0048690 [Trypanosoma cruzi]|nr:hypothetical protein TcYC6_0048690 [Trypanosoma cruzi]